MYLLTAMGNIVDDQQFGDVLVCMDISETTFTNFVNKTTLLHGLSIISASNYCSFYRIYSLYETFIDFGIRYYQQ